jgi:glycosyltransferase involved in cell wall biosynthesis
MKILRVSPSYARYNKPGSGYNAYYHSKNSLDQVLIITTKQKEQLINDLNNVEIIEVSTFNSNLGKIDSNFLIRQIRLTMKIISQFLFFIQSIKFIKKFKPNVVHVYTPIPAIIALYCKMKYKSSIFISLHGTDMLRIQKNKLFQNLIRKFDDVLVVSEDMIETLNKYDISATYIGNGYDERNYYRDRNVIREPIIINVGNLRWQKSQKTLIKAFEIFVKKYPEFKLNIVGEGELRIELEQLIYDLSLEKKIKLIGYLHPKEINQLLNRSKIFVLSSSTEGSPKVILEAMATGTVVVSTNVGNVLNTIKDSGIVVSSENPYELYIAMEKILICNYDELSNKAIDYSKEFSWENVRKRLKEVYNAKKT